MSIKSSANNSKNILLYWLREQDCDAGTRVTVEELEPAVRERVAALIAEAPRPMEPWLVRLPFLDRKEWRKRDEILRALPMERLGSLIRTVLDPAHHTRDSVATYAMTDPAWQKAPTAAQPGYFETWQRVSVELQQEIKTAIGDFYFSNLDRFDDRQLAYTVLAYQVSRPHHPRSRTEMTYDLSDYPNCTAILAQATRMITNPVRKLLVRTEEMLLESGKPELSRRYSPLWSEDVVRTARQRRHQFVELMAAETRIVEVILNLGADRSFTTINHCARVINQALRGLLGIDMRPVGASLLDAATRSLAGVLADRADHLSGTGANQDGHVAAARSPHSRVAR